MSRWIGGVAAHAQAPFRLTRKFRELQVTVAHPVSKYDLITFGEVSRLEVPEISDEQP
jgi:hypothetical protein